MNSILPGQPHLESTNGPTLLRGRKRRRARRQIQHSQDGDHPFSSSQFHGEAPSQSSEPILVLRGRQRRKARRQWQISQDPNYTIRTPDLAALETSRSPARAPVIRPAGFARVTRRAAVNRNHGSAEHSWKPPKAPSEPPTVDSALPWWFTSRSLEEPVCYRRISDLLESVEPRETLCIDLSIARAIHRVGRGHSNDLLKILLDSYKNATITIAGIADILRWVTLPMFKFLQDMALPLRPSELLLGLVSNLENGQMILHYLLETNRWPGMDDSFFNYLLDKVFKSVTSPVHMRNFFDFQDKGTHLKVYNTLIQAEPGRQIYSAILTNAVEALIRFEAWTHHCSLDAGVLKPLTERCKEPYDAHQLLESALGACKPQGIRALLNIPAVERISKKAMINLFYRDAFVHSSMYVDTDPLMPLLGVVATVKDLLPSPETVFVNVQNYYIGPKVLRCLLMANPKLEITPLMARTMLAHFPPRKIWKCLRSSEIPYNARGLLEALSENRPSRHQKRVGVEMFSYILSRSPKSAVTPQAITAVALAMPAPVLETVLAHNTNVKVSQLALLASTRSTYPAVEKVRLILEKSNLEQQVLEHDFWTSLINNNHHDTVQVFDLLRSRFVVATDDALVVAAWRSDASAALIKRLLQDKSFSLSIRTITAILHSDTGVAKPRLFKWLLNKVKGLVIDADVIVDSFYHPEYCRLLLKHHGDPRKLVVSAAKLRGSLYVRTLPGDHMDWEAEPLRASVYYYLKVGGLFTLSLECLETLLHVDFEVAVEIWRSQRSVSFLDLVTAAINRTPHIKRSHLTKGEHSIYGVRARKELCTLVDILVSYGNRDIDKVMFDAFSPRNATIEGDARDDISYWAVTLFMHRLNDLSRFEDMCRLSKRFELPSSEVEWLIASFVAVEDMGDWNRDLTETIQTIIETFDISVLGHHFFQTIQDLTDSVFFLGESVPRAWDTLLDSSLRIDWSLLAQGIMFSVYPVELITRIMLAIGDEFTPCEQVALAAISAKDPLPKVEFLWSRDPEMAVTPAMIIAAVRSNDVETLDFLIVRSAPLEVTEDLIRTALETPDNYGDATFLTKDEMVITLMAHTEDIRLSPATVELAIRNLQEETAQRLLDRNGNAYLHNGAVLAMLDQKWPAERIHHTMKGDTRGTLHDPEVVSAACRSEQGRILMKLAGFSGQHKAAMQAALLAEAPMQSTNFDWRILDHIDTAPHIVLNDKEVAHLWEECTRSAYSRHQPLEYLLEHGATGHIGPETFKSFYGTCIKWQDRHRSDVVGRDKVSGNLPRLPAIVNAEMITVAREMYQAFASFVYLLGPDHAVKVEESALQECARLGNLIWLVRLLQKMSVEQLSNIDKEALLAAAYVSANKDVVGLCRWLADIVESKEEVRWRLLDCGFYIRRQRLRVGRPKVVNVWRRGFGRFLQGTCGAHRRS